MTKRKSPTIDVLQDEITRLKWDMHRLESNFATEVAPVATDLPKTAELKVYFERASGERRPYLIRFEGLVSATVKLSAVRASILLVLLVDLEDRGDGGQGVLDLLRAMNETYYELSPLDKNDPISVTDRIRVAMYRFSDFFSEDLGLKTDRAPLKFDHRAIRIFGHAGRAPVVEISSSDSVISGVIDRLLSTSPLARIRRYKTMFIPSGISNYDRLLLEFFDHRFPVAMTSMFVRPSVNSYPPPLLKKIGVSSNTLRRREIFGDGLKQGRFRHRELLRRDSIWDLIRADKKGRFTSYPFAISKAEVDSHLKHIGENLSEHRNYELILTDAPFQFLLVSIVIESGKIPEHYTLLYQYPNQESLYDISAFVIYDRNVGQSVSTMVVEWVLNHATTVGDRKKIDEELELVRTYLKKHGPLGIGESRPK